MYNEEKDVWEVVPPWDRKVSLNTKRDTKGPNKRYIVFMFFIPYTPHNTLKKWLQEVEDEFSQNRYGRVKMVETIGPKLNQELSSNKPRTKDHCGRPEYPPCKTRPGSCLKRNITYKVSCSLCDSIYSG